MRSGAGYRRAIVVDRGASCVATGSRRHPHPASATCGDVIREGATLGNQRASIQYARSKRMFSIPTRKHGIRSVRSDHRSIGNREVTESELNTASHFKDSHCSVTADGHLSSGTIQNGVSVNQERGGKPNRAVASKSDCPAVGDGLAQGCFVAVGKRGSTADKRTD